MKSENNSKKYKSKKFSAFVIVFWCLMFFYALTFIYVLCFGFLVSLKSVNEYVIGNVFTGEGPNILGLPNIKLSKQLAELEGTSYSLFGNYKFVFDGFKFTPDNVSYFTMFNVKVDHYAHEVGILSYLFNTLIYCGVCPLLTVLVSATSGYLCCKYKFKYSNFIYTLLLITMAIPLVGTNASTLNMLKKIGIFDTYFSMIIQNMHFGGLYFFVFFAFFKGLSDTYIDAAEIDGANQFCVLVKIIYPLAWKTMLTVFIIMFMGLWNTYEAPMLYYPTKPTLAYGIYWMANSTANTNFDTQSAPVKVAGCMTLCIPALILFICLKDVMMGNLTLGGLKE